MFTLQQQIASDVAVAAGRRRLTAPRAQTIDPKAYEAYLNGLGARGVERHEGFRRAVAYLEQAVAIQPDFAAAYAELAMVQVQFLFGGPYSPHQIMPQAEAAARKALQLDDNLPRATGRWARYSTCITGVGRKATRHWSGPRSWAMPLLQRSATH